MFPDEAYPFSQLPLGRQPYSPRFLEAMGHVPSAVRVFGKSLYLLAIGWFAGVCWLWTAGLRQQQLRQGTLPPDYAVGTILYGALSALAIAALAFWIGRFTGSAPNRSLERREWHHAFWWSAFPNVMLLGTVYLMITAAY